MYHVGTRDRFYLEYSDIPLNMINAIMAAEDKTFFEHKGFDLKGIANAFIINIRNIFKKTDSNYVGASTITQQLVKNILLMIPSVKISFCFKFDILYSFNSKLLSLANFSILSKIDFEIVSPILFSLQPEVNLDL